MWIRMTRDHDYRVTKAQVVAYRGGAKYLVKREWGDAMVEIGAAKELTTPARRTRAKAE